MEDGAVEAQTLVQHGGLEAELVDLHLLGLVSGDEIDVRRARRGGEAGDDGRKNPLGEAAGFETLGIAEVGQERVGDVERQARHGGELVDVDLLLQQRQDALACLQEGRVQGRQRIAGGDHIADAGVVVLEDDLVGLEGFLLVGVAAADGQVQPIREVVGGLGEGGPGFVVEFSAGTEVGDREVENIRVLAVLVEVIATEDPVQTIVAAQQLQLLGHLCLVEIVVELGNTLWRVITVPGEVRIQVPPAGDGFQRQGIREVIGKGGGCAVQVGLGFRRRGALILAVLTHVAVVVAVGYRGIEGHPVALGIRGRAGHAGRYGRGGYVVDERHGRRRCQHHALQLAEIGEVDAQQSHGRAVLAIPGGLDAHVGTKPIVGHPGEGQATGQGIVVAEILAVGALHVAVLVQRSHRQPRGHGVADRQIQRAFGVQQVVRASRHGHRTAELAAGFRLHRGDRYGAADGVAAEQRALGTAQHLQLLDVDDVQDGPHGAGDVDAIHVQTHAGLGGGQELLLTHPAQIDSRGVGGAAEAGVVFQGHAGHELGDLIQAGDAPVVERLTGVGGDGDGCVLQPLFPHAGGHHDLFQHLGRAVPSLRLFLSLRRLRRVGRE